MRKAVAVPYIIALLLGVAVIGLLGYWFASSGGKFGGQSSKTICDNKFLQYCVQNPTSSYSSFKTGTECANIGGSYDTCSQVLGTTSGGNVVEEPQSTIIPAGGECDTTASDGCDFGGKKGFTCDGNTQCKAVASATNCKCQT